MPNRSRSGAESMPGRVVAATSVKGRSAYLSVRACMPLSMTKLTAKSSIAGYRSSSTGRGRRWTSSMKRTSCSARFVRIPMSSAPRSIAGPDVGTRFVPISFAMMPASVVLPRPGGP